MWLALRRWPLVLGAVVCLAFGVYVLDHHGEATAAAWSLLVLGAVMLGAFLALYARDQN